MTTFQTPLSPGRVDHASATIYGVSVCSLGAAKGHGLIVDETTLDQMQACARAKGQVPVKVDHKAGAAAVCGYLTNFRRSGMKLVADWHLLETHPLTSQIQETAERMPSGVGLSAAFVSDDSEPGKARCVELISVDYVTMPAANPSGLFSRPERRDILEKTGRVLDGGRVGAEVAGIGAGAAYAIRKIAKAKRLPKITSPSFKKGLASAVGKGAIFGGVAGAAYRVHRDTVDEARRFERETIRQILFERPALRRIEAATADELRKVDLPGAAAAKNKRLRSILSRGGKIAVGATLGHIAGKRLGKAGAVAGGLAGALFSRPSSNLTSMQDNHHREITRLVEQAAQPIRQNCSESHDLESLGRRLFCTPAQAAKLLDEGILESLGPIHRGDRGDGPQGFRSNDLNNLQRSILKAVAEEIIDATDAKDLDSLRLTITQALRQYKERLSKPAQGDTQRKEFSRRVSGNGAIMLAQPEEERPGLFHKAATGAAVAGGIYAGASAIRGARSGSTLVDAIRRGHRANVGTLKKVGAAVRPGLRETARRILRAAGRPV